MKKLYYIILLIYSILFYGCVTHYNLINDFDHKFDKEYKIDSVCNIERIPVNKNKWRKIILTTDSSYFYQYIYILNTDSTNITYTITDLDSLYRIKKKTLKIQK